MGIENYMLHDKRSADYHCRVAIARLFPDNSISHRTESTEFQLIDNLIAQLSVNTHTVFP